MISFHRYITLFKPSPFFTTIRDFRTSKTISVIKEISDQYKAQVPVHTTVYLYLVILFVCELPITDMWQSLWTWAMSQHWEHSEFSEHWKRFQSFQVRAGFKHWDWPLVHSSVSAKRVITERQNITKSQES
jgi:hypothetical protein